MLYEGTTVQHSTVQYKGIYGVWHHIFEIKSVVVTFLTFYLNEKQMFQCPVVSENSGQVSKYVMFTVKVSATPCPSEEGRAAAMTGYISLIS